MLDHVKQAQRAKELDDFVNAELAKGRSLEDIGKEIIHIRNESRIQSHIDRGDLKAAEFVRKRQQSPEELLKKRGGDWMEVIKGSTKTNDAADVVVDLYKTN